MVKAKTKVPRQTEVQYYVELLIEQYGGLRALARARDIDPGYLWRIRRGRVRTVGPKTLSKLGLHLIEKLAPI